MMPILQASGVITPGQLGPIIGSFVRQELLDAHHVEDRMPSVMHTISSRRRRPPP
jgi:hypothetical protein